MAVAIITRVLNLVDSLEAFIRGSNALPPCIPGLREDIAELQRTLTSIRSAVHGAEEKQATDESAKRWLAQLRASAYDAEDVMEEFNYQLRSTVDAANPPLSAPPVADVAPLVLIALAVGLKGLRERFQEISRVREVVQAGEEGGAKRADTRCWRPTGGLMDGESLVFGRDKDKEEILKQLPPPSTDGESNAAKLTVLPIVGMAGLGKTTLAQLIYNDDQMKHFEVRMWIHVSQDFDVIKLTRAMVECATGEPCLLSELHLLQSELEEKVAGKCFFLVLDDVWDDSGSHWENLRIPLLSAHKESKVLLTTRSHSVAKSMGTKPSYNLEPLKDDDCWSLFCEKAFHGQTQDKCLVKIGKKIVQKCKGLPLTLKVLGLLLRGEEHEDRWSEILESNMWDLSGCQDSIVPILMLSYLQLPTPIKQCFTYCSIFGKGHQFLRQKTVRMWVAQDFIETDGRRKVEDVGCEYFDVLLSRSFFQHSKEDGYFVMHDLVHDLAVSISEGECFRMDVLPGKECSGMEVDRELNFPRGVRHSSLTFCSTSTEADFRPLFAAKSLRTLFLNYTSGTLIKPLMHHRHANVLNDLFIKLKYLRVLFLDCTFSPRLPDSVGNLKFLRYLGVLSVNLKSFPQSICALENLQTLEWDSVEKIMLPQGTSNLINLRCLDGPYCAAFPEGIGRLTKLQQLPEFHVPNRHDYAGMEELKDLADLQGELKILNLENVTYLEDAMEANLKGKPDLTTLDLRWSKDSGYRNNASAVLQCLQPHTNIQEVRIHEYKHDHLSEWLCHPSYCKLVTIRLQSCMLSALPSFGQLLSLKHLSLEYIRGLKYIGPAFFCGGFPSLKILQLNRIEHLVEWSGAEQGHLPQLNELVVVNCQFLERLPLNNLTALQILWISYCSKLQTLYYESSPHFIGIQQHGSIKHLQIVGCPKLKFLPEYQIPASLRFLEVSRSSLLINWCHKNLGKLLHVQKIRGLDSMEVILNDIFTVEEARNACLNRQCIYMLHLEWEPSLDSTGCTYDEANEVLECLQPNATLNRLAIRGYNGSSFAGWLSSPSFSNLVNIRLESCPECMVLPALGQLQYLMELYLERLHGIKSIGLEFYGNDTTKGFPSLRRLELMSMAGLEVWQGASDGEFPTLRQLIVRDCIKLRGLPCLSPSVQEIKVENCPELILDLSSNLSSLLNLHVSNISVMKELRKLSYLSVLVVEKCMSDTLAELPTLRDLVVSGCNERMLLDSLPGLTALTTLKISCLTNLESLPLHNFRILEELVISECPKLISIECFSTFSYEPYYVDGLLSLSFLKHMTITACPELYFSASEQLPPTLQSIRISGCRLLRIWYQRYSSRFDVSGIVFDD
ncbi:disease resistance protein RGA2-like [Musa acuminata AAA Group]|uniref:disease resistance protein RGA2-like n=1 Tax=Musa acuminata AAA Group TaxID=214697 RepID=UPI0031DCAB44